MARYTNLADILRGAGLSVVEDSGWRTRGAELADIRAIMLHHTATPTSSYRGNNAPTLGTVRNGRAGLPGPLAQFVLGRDGTWYVVASGLANHAGNGSGWGLPTNNANKYTLAIEAESSGVGSDWTDAQLSSYPRGVAALCEAFGLAWHRVIAHKEWAPSRKIDPAGWPGDVDGFRLTVRNILEGKGAFMALTDNDQNLLFELVKDMAKGKGGRNAAGDQYLSEQAQVAEIHAKLDVLGTGLAQVSEAVGRLQGGAPAGLTKAELEQLVYDAIDRRLDN